MYSPVFVSLRKWFPNSQIDVVFDELGKQLYGTDKHISKFYLFNRKTDGVRKQFALIKQFRYEHYDYSFHFRSGVRNEMLAYFGNVNKRIGYKLNGSWQFLTHKFDKQVDLHASENYKFLIEKVFNKVSDDFPFLPINNNYKTEVDRFLEEKINSKKYVVLHPFGTTISQENWNLELFYDLIVEIEKPIFVFGTNGEISNLKKIEKANVYLMANKDLAFVSEFIRGASFFHRQR